MINYSKSHTPLQILEDLLKLWLFLNSGLGYGTELGKGKGECCKLKPDETCMSKYRYTLNRLSFLNVSPEN